MEPVPSTPPRETQPPPRLGLGALLIFAVFAIALIAGLLPRFRHNHELSSDTHELAVPTVDVVQAKPGQKLSGMLLPAEVRPFVETPIYARAAGYVTKW